MTKRARITVKTDRSRLTRREAELEFNRKKSKARRRQLKRRGLLGAAAVLSLATLVGGWWIERSGRLERTATAFSDIAFKTSAGAGFVVKQIYLSGREHADAAAVKKALGVSPGAPILSVSLTDIQTRLEAIAEIKSATVTRQLPDALRITLIEREPVAWWQRGDAHALMDIDGVVLAREHYRQVDALPVLVGADAPKHVRELVALLAEAPSLKPEVLAAVRVGERRWNIQLKRDITVMLPEERPAAAWKRFAGLVQQKGLLNKAIRSVDMRLEDRVFIMPIAQGKTMITLTSGRET